MSNGQQSSLGAGEYNNIIRDVNGNIIVQIDSSEYAVMNPDGTILQKHNYEHLQLTNGFMWNPNMLRANPPKYIAVCDFCRNPPVSIFNPQVKSHGIILYEHGKFCVCGQFCCPRHITYSQDGGWRCPNCHRSHGVKDFVTSIFFKEVQR